MSLSLTYYLFLIYLLLFELKFECAAVTNLIRISFVCVCVFSFPL